MAAKESIMLAEALTALAAAGGTAVVSAMATDAWGAVRTRTARLFGRGDKKREAAAEERLNRAREEMAKLSGAELDQASARQQAAWSARLADLLEDHPETETELRALVEYAQSQMTHSRSTGHVQQHVVGHDHARQAVLGHGVMNVNFGDQQDQDDNG
jgi:hypothetical protein